MKLFVGTGLVIISLISPVICSGNRQRKGSKDRRIECYGDWCKDWDQIGEKIIEMFTGRGNCKCDSEEETENGGGENSNSGGMGGKKKDIKNKHPICLLKYSKYHCLAHSNTRTEYGSSVRHLTLRIKYTPKQNTLKTFGKLKIRLVYFK